MLCCLDVVVVFDVNSVFFCCVNIVDVVLMSMLCFYNCLDVVLHTGDFIRC